jgi:beta-galactosidase
MIEQHFNHPSIIIWGLGNENDWPGDFVEFDKEKIRAFMSQMNSIAHTLDASRKTAIRRCDFCKDIVDVYSPSIWAGWYKGIFTDYKAFTKLYFDKVNHFLHAEWGGDSHAKRFSETPDNELKKVVDSISLETRQNNIEVYKTAISTTKDGDWNENYICNLFDWHLKEQETMPWLSGSAQWVFKDFATPLRPENPVPYINQKGVVERDFTKKEGYYVFQSYWSKEPMLRIFGHNFTTRWGAENEEKMIKVYSNCSQVELFLNGKSLGIHQRNSQDFPAAGLRWSAVFKKGMNIVVAKATNTTISDTVIFMYQTDVWSKPSYATVEKIATTNDTTTVQVKVFDSKGIPCLDATNWVRYSIAGDGQLIENQGTSSGSRYVQMTNGTSIIRIKTNKGKSVVSAAVKGVETVLLTL